SSDFVSMEWASENELVTSTLGIDEKQTARLWNVFMPAQSKRIPNQTQQALNEEEQLPQRIIPINQKGWFAQIRDLGAEFVIEDTFKGYEWGRYDLLEFDPTGYSSYHPTTAEKITILDDLLLWMDSE